MIDKTEYNVENLEANLLRIGLEKVFEADSDRLKQLQKFDSGNFSGPEIGVAEFSKTITLDVILDLNNSGYDVIYLQYFSLGNFWSRDIYGNVKCDDKHIDNPRKTTTVTVYEQVGNTRKDLIQFSVTNTNTCMSDKNADHADLSNGNVELFDKSLIFGKYFGTVNYSYRADNKTQFYWLNLSEKSAGSLGFKVDVTLSGKSASPVAIPWVIGVGLYSIKFYRYDEMNKMFDLLQQLALISSLLQLFK